ncbi:hypothetical protein [Egibacter rhizosphaerae]|uniref:hypothetical protein n=1 Tax=Egibacter rhizosphaerae TaxID=1670831 RepID=UPI001F0EDE78|nr:hypothetical protein [Egibacter rhizosphaerae]
MEQLQSFTESLPELLAWFGVLVAGAVPFVESYFGSVIGVVAGVHPAAAIPVAILGNAVTMLVLVMGAGAARGRLASDEPTEPSSRRRKLRRMFDRFGVPGVSLLGQSVLPSQITAAAMVSFGASRSAVIGWQLVSITLWGVAFGLLAVTGMTVADLG